MSRAWMPLYIGDYLADTGHLTTVEHGCYLLLIMHYWRNGGLPTDDVLLARIARMTPVEWADARPVVAGLFSDGWKHKRVEFELTQAARISEAGRKGGQASAAKRSTTVEQPLDDDPTIGQALHSPSPSKKEKKERKRHSENETTQGRPSDPVDPSVEERGLFERGKQVLGKSAGGQITKLKQAKGGNVALARAVIEAASTKENPGEYVAAVIRGPPQGSPQALRDHKTQEWENARAALRESIARDRERQANGGSLVRILPEGSG